MNQSTHHITPFPLPQHRLLHRAGVHGRPRRHHFAPAGPGPRRLVHRALARARLHRQLLRQVRRQQAGGCACMPVAGWGCACLPVVGWGCARMPDVGWGRARLLPAAAAAAAAAGAGGGSATRGGCPPAPPSPLPAPIHAIHLCPTATTSTSSCPPETCGPRWGSGGGLPLGCDGSGRGGAGQAGHEQEGGGGTHLPVHPPTHPPTHPPVCLQDPKIIRSLRTPGNEDCLYRPGAKCAPASTPFRYRLHLTRERRRAPASIRAPGRVLARAARCGQAACPAHGGRVLLPTAAGWLLARAPLALRPRPPHASPPRLACPAAAVHPCPAGQRQPELVRSLGAMPMSEPGVLLAPGGSPLNYRQTGYYLQGA